MTDLTAFLDEFDRISTGASTDLAAVFCSPFLAMDRASMHALTPEQLAKVLPARRAMFEAAGVVAVRRGAASETPIDAEHRMLRVEWQAERAGRPAVTLASTFVIRTIDGAPRIAVYINHNDVHALLAQ